MSLAEPLRTQVATTIRMMAADAIQKANSGHPGAPLGLADIALVLWDEFLRFDPTAPGWPARDRFVLSCGHASSLLYSLLHLYGYDLPLEQVQSFRQWGSHTPGHPEYGETVGVETTTGPLGQGVAASVGIALAAKMLSARVDAQSETFTVMPQRVFALCSDGDLMEGISSEAASMAGHWRLGNLTWVYDDNKITIDGTTEVAFTEDVGKRFEAFGWQVLKINGHCPKAIRAALNLATAQSERPTLIVARTHIGFGSPNKVDTSSVHGSPLGKDELARTKANLGWPAEPAFHVPAEVAAYFAEAKARKIAEHKAYEAGFAAWRTRNADKAALFDELFAGKVPEDLWEKLLAATSKAGATRKLSGEALKAAAALLPGLVGGSADLRASTALKLEGDVGHPETSSRYAFSYAGRQIHFGIREHAMGAVTNGLLQHGGLRPFGATFLVFSDYERPAIRLAALGHLPNIFVFTHDSVFLGEDGPTHQPVEHHWALRDIPGLTYLRPADGLETAMTWAYALQVAKEPVAMAFTRQDLPEIKRPAGFDPRLVWRGAYEVVPCDKPDVILVGTGSELFLCTGAAEKLASQGKKVRVVSMPSVDLFLAQDAAYQEALIPSNHPAVVTVEAGITGPWARISGRRGLNLGLDRYGASAPDTVLAEQFGFTVEAVTARIEAYLR